MTEGVAGLAGQEGGEMVDADEGEGRGGRGGDEQGGVGEGGVAVVDGDGVMRVGGVAADVADDGEGAAGGVGGGQGGGREEGRDGGGEVDAVDEDVALEDLREGPALGRLGQVPFEDVRRRQTDLAEEVDGAFAASTERADDQGARVAAGVAAETGLDGAAHVRQQVFFARIAADPR